jgi:steroid 5-alpha reductase family enzyme
MWWGIWIISCGIELGWVTVYSCIFITVLLRFVSGVPFPEKKYAKNPEWQQYCCETNVFCLWFAKPNAVMK